MNTVHFSSLMEQYDTVDWDAQLFRDIYGETLSESFDQEIAMLVQKELMDCENVSYNFIYEINT